MPAPTGILAMLAKPKGKGGAEKSGPPALEDEAGSEAGDALLEMFSALKSGDGAGAELAFKRAMAACEDMEADDDMSDLGMGDEDEISEEE
jgi:hypothetical protein